MTTGTKTFRAVICILLGLTVLWTAFISFAFFHFVGSDVERRDGESYGLYVGGVEVTTANAHDILGNGILCTFHSGAPSLISYIRI